jgi:hypothetical protein
VVPGEKIKVAHYPPVNCIDILVFFQQPTIARITVVTRKRKEIDAVRSRYVCVVASIRSLAACECAELFKRQAFKYAAVVFRGRVTKIDHMNPIEPPRGTDGAVKLASIPRSRDDHTLVTFQVTASWKGPVTRTLEIFATARPSMCDGYKFKEDTEYVVYATRNLNRAGKN